MTFLAKNKLLFLLIGLFIVNIQPVYAHGFGEKYNLPLPLWLYIYGGGATVALSFILIGLFVKISPGADTYPKINLLKFRCLAIFTHTYFIYCLKTTSSILLVLLILCGLFGDQNPFGNITPTFVWIIWWVGIAYISALVGNIWLIINPWRNIFTFFEYIHYRLYGKQEENPRIILPIELGVWPGLVLFFIFSWFELVYPTSYLPRTLAYIVIFYSTITWSGMYLIGKNQWIARCDPFSIAFQFLSKFSPLEIASKNTTICTRCNECNVQEYCLDCHQCFSASSNLDRQINLRPYGVGLLSNQDVDTSKMYFVLLLLAVVTFDGFTSTPLWSSALDFMFDTFSFLFGRNAIVEINSIGLFVSPIIFYIIYWGFCKAMTNLSGPDVSTDAVCRLFIYSLIPIALAYHLSHYLTYILIQGQLIIPLVSDPLGVGWDIINTKSYEVNTYIVGPRFAWITSVISIVTGHVIAVYIAHIVAIRNIKDRSKALMSQYPMLVLMVGYTAVSLWIIAQPIVERT